MCLSFPGKIIAIKGDFASVDYGPDGIRDNINITLVEPEIGGYVLVQGGFAIRTLTKSDAEETLNIWKAIRQEFEQGSTEEP